MKEIVIRKHESFTALKTVKTEYKKSVTNYRRVQKNYSTAMHKVAVAKKAIKRATASQKSIMIAKYKEVKDHAAMIKGQKTDA